MVDGPECAICMERRIAITLVPCNHTLVCRTCYVALPAPKACPKCRVAVEAATVVFIG